MSFQLLRRSQPQFSKSRFGRIQLQQLEERDVPALVAAFGFNESAGTTAADSSGTGNTGAISGAAWTTSGKYGAALTFDGINDWVTVADANSLDLTTAMTLEAWVQPTTINGWETVILKEAAGDLAYALYADNNGNDSGGQRRPVVSVRQSGATYFTSGNSQLAVSQWTHLAATYDGAVLRFFVNGTQASTLNRTGPINTSSNPLRMGGNGIWSEWFNGQIDEVRVYSHALTAAEIVSDMNTPIADNTPPTVTSVSPSSGASAVNTSANITATFNEALEATTVDTSTFELRDPSNALVQASVWYNAATLTAILDPTALLEPGTTYTATLRGGANDPRVKDLAGNALASDYVWSFTTAPLSISINDVSVNEGNTGTAIATFTVALNGVSTQTVSVNYATANGTATAGADYTAIANTSLSFAPGETSKPITVVVLGDTAGEGNETFFVNLTSPANAVIGDGQGIGTILDDDATQIGSEGFGYSAFTHAFETIDLVPGGTGVFTIRSTGNNNANLVTLTTGNTFNFYGTTYGSFYVSTNGLVTFGSSNTSASNADLTTAPTQRALAPMWDDWVNVSGQTMELGRYDDLDSNGTADRLIIEWNNVQGNTSTPSPVTFQTILQLNTGTVPGTATFNYSDLDAGTGNAYSNAGTATVGFKDAGTQGTRRLLVSFNSTASGYVGSGKAIRIVPDTTLPSVDVTAPADGATVSGTVTVSATAADNTGVAGVQFLLDGAPLSAEDMTAPYSISWNTSGLSGAHVLTARARDITGNTKTSQAVNVTVSDTVPPSVSLTAPANNSTVSGSTTVSATASDNVGVVGVQFQLDGAPLGGEDTTAPYSLSWDTTGATDGAHQLTAVARDAAGNSTTSSIVNVTVANNDTTPPTVTMTSPTDNSTVSGSVTVSATASDNVAVVGVQFLHDGNPLGAEDTTAPYSLSWNTLLESNSLHTLSAVARDAAGNTGNAQEITVTVNNDGTPPSVSLTNPSDGATVSGTTAVSADATDNVGVVGVQFSIDGNALGAEDTVAPYEVNWNTLTVGNGNHLVTAAARDAAGNSASASISVTVSNTDDVPPTVLVTSPANGTTVSGTISVNATASDNVGVSGVQFLLDGNPLGAEDTASPYSTSWNTTTAGNGFHNLAARARDAAGNVTTSAISVIVSNGGVALTINGATTFQTIDGFGVNVNAHSWNNGEVIPALDMLADQMGSTLFRVVYDMEDWESVNDNADPNVSDWTYFNALYSNASFQELWGTLRHLNQKGIVSGISLSFMGRVPTWMGGSVINTAFEDEWVETISTLVYYAHNTENLQFAILDPINEPDWDGIEGPQVDQWQYVRLLHKLALKLDALGLGDIEFSGPNTAAIGTGVNTYMPEMMGDPLVMSKLNHVGLHNYAGSTGGAAAAIQGSQYPGTHFWITEVTNPPEMVMQIGGNANGILVWDGFDSAYIHPTLHGANMTPPNDAGNGPSPLAYNVNTGIYTPRKSFYEDQQLFKFAPPGSVRISAAESNGSLTIYAYYHQATDRITIVGRSTSGSNINVVGSLSNLPAATSFELYKTDAGSNFARQADVLVTNGSFAFVAPANSYFTLTTLAAPDTTPPTVSMTAPANGATVAGTVTVSAVASDDRGVAGVQFFLDGSPLGAEDTLSPYSFQWNTTTVLSGVHILEAKARDAAGNIAFSSHVTVTVNNDATPPTVTVTAPADGATATGTVSVTADAADNTAVVGVQFLLDGVALGSEDTNSPYGINWDTTVVPNGQHALAARARDAAGNTATASIAITVSNTDSTPPNVTLTSPADGATVAGAVPINATASDNVGVAGVQFFIDGVIFGAEDTVAPYSIIWNTSSADNGTHILTAVARDAAGNTATSANVTVTVITDDTPPNVNITSPANGATVSGTVAVSANASDNIGVVGVQFLLNGSPLGAEDTAAPYSVNWSTTTVANGNYTLSAIARDASGNTATAANITVTVNNVSGLVAAYGFNEGSGTALTDASGNGLNGVISGATWSTTGKFGGALSFDGVNDWVTINDNNLLDLTTAMTLEAWVRPTVINGWETVLMKETTGELVYAIYADNNGNDTGGPRRPATWIRQGSTSYGVTGNAQLAVNTWSHLAATYDGSNLRLFANGTQVGSLARTGSMITSSSPLRFGGNNVWSEWFNGLIDEVRIYNRALTAAEITTDMNTPVGGGGGAQLADRIALTTTTNNLTEDQVASMLPVAVQAWVQAGIPAHLTSAFTNVPMQLVDLPGLSLGFTNVATREIWIDRDAAGAGWFVDSTPNLHEEFDLLVSSSVFLATGGPAANRYDLLTVLSHELGHLLGLESDLPGTDEGRTSDDLMNKTLSVGTRRMPSRLDVGLVLNIDSGGASTTELTRDDRGLPPVTTVFGEAVSIPSVLALDPKADRILNGQLNLFEQWPNRIDDEANRWLVSASVLSLQTVGDHRDFRSGLVQLVEQKPDPAADQLDIK